MRKKLLTVLCFLFALVLGLSVLAACGDAEGDIELGETSFTFAVGETHNLTASAKEGGEITWTTSDESVVSIQMQVASRGIVMLKAEKAGTATITATSQSGKTATCTATVENITVDISGTGVADGKLQMERYSTTQLTATVKRDGQPMSDGVRWTSSDESIVTVSTDGKLEALKPGNAVITATRVNSTVHSDLNVTVVWTAGPTGWYELHDWEQNKITPNLWGYWVDAGYEGANVKVTRAEYLGDPTGTGLVAGGVTVTYENQNDVQNEHGMQLFYRSSKAYNDANKDKEGFEPYDASELLLDVNAHYLLKMDITVTASGTITVNGTQVDVVANQKQSIEIPFNHTDDGRIYADGDWTNVSSAVYLMMGANNTMIQAATVTIENVSWEPWDGSSAKLQTPTLSVSGKNVTITDPNTEGVKNYTVGLFEKDAEEGAEPVRMVTSTAKTFVLDDSKWPNGEYELRVRANGKDLRYSDSEWSAGVDHTVSHGAVQYDLTQGTSAQAKADLSDTYYYYTEGATVETATYNDGVITLKYSGNSSWTAMQLFYKNPSLTNGTKYTLTFKLNSPLAGKIRINGNMFDLVEGNNDIEVSYTEGSGADGLSMNIQFGEPTSDYSGTASVLTEGTFTLSDIVWATYTAPEGSIPEGAEADAVNHPGTFYLWSDHAEWNGANVTVSSNSIDYENKTISFSYTSEGDSRYGAGVQLFYEHPGAVDGKVYTITLTIKVSVTCDIRVCGQVEHFEANVARTLTITQAEPGNAGQYNEGATIAVLMGTYESETSFTNVKAAEVTVTNWSVTDATTEKLQTPTDLAIAEDGTVTFTDPNDAAKVGGYELGFFKGDTLKGQVTVTKGGKIDDSAIANDAYNVKVRALGKDASYTVSDWSQGVEYTVNNAGGPSYDITATTGETAVGGSPDGKYYYWKENGTVAGSYTNGMLTVTVTGNTGNWYNVQIFMADPSLKVGGVYSVKMTLTLNVSGKIKVNGIDPVTLTANTPYSYENNNWTQQAGKASVSIQLGSEGVGVVAESCTLTIENVSFTEAAKLATPSFTLAGKVITITDTQNEGATYELGFFKKADDAAPANTLQIANGGTIKDEMIPAGDYTLKLRAVKAGSSPSDWSQGTSYTVEKGDVDYTIVQNGSEGDSDGKWIFWNDNSVTVDYVRLYEEDGKSRITVKESSNGSVEWGFQLFYNDTKNFPNGKQYKLTMTANAKSAMTVKVNGQEFALTANTDKAIETTVTPSFNGNPDGMSLVDLQVPQAVGTTYEFELKDIAWAAVGGSDPTPAPTEGTEMTKLASKDGSDLVKGKWSYYAADNVTVKTATVSADGKTVTITVSDLAKWDDLILFFTPEGFEDGSTHNITLKFTPSSSSPSLPGAFNFLMKNRSEKPGEYMDGGFAYNQATPVGYNFIVENGVFFNMIMGFDNQTETGVFTPGEVTFTISEISYN